MLARGAMNMKKPTGWLYRSLAMLETSAFHDAAESKWGWVCWISSLFGTFSEIVMLNPPTYHQLKSSRMEANRNLAGDLMMKLTSCDMPQHRICYFLAAGSVYSFPWESCIFWLQDGAMNWWCAVVKNVWQKGWRYNITRWWFWNHSWKFYIFLPPSLGKYCFNLTCAYVFLEWVGSTTNKSSVMWFGRRNHRSWWAWYIPMMWLRLGHNTGGGGKNNRKRNTKFLVLKDCEVW